MLLLVLPQAVYALANLAVSGKYRAATMEAGAVPILVDLLSSQDDVLRLQVCTKEHTTYNLAEQTAHLCVRVFLRMVLLPAVVSPNAPFLYISFASPVLVYSASPTRLCMYVDLRTQCSCATPVLLNALTALNSRL